MLVYLKPLQRYYKKCTYASKVRKLFAKKIDFIYLIRYTALAQAKLESELEYVPHRANVATGELASAK